jgi:hypothetical protein
MTAIDMNPTHQWKGTNWHNRLGEQVPEVSWYKCSDKNKTFYYDNRSGRKRRTTLPIAYSVQKLSGIQNLYDMDGNVIRSNVPSLVACLRIIRDRIVV